MKKCKDCIHYAVCGKKPPEDTSFSAEQYCPDDFKDKKLVKVLPCEAGDTIYVPQGGSKFKSHIVENFIVTPDMLIIKTADGYMYDADDTKDGILLIKPVTENPSINFTIETLNDNGSGMLYKTKEAFMSEISKMVDDCIENGGTFFDAQIDSDVSCFCNE